MFNIYIYISLSLAHADLCDHKVRGVRTQRGGENQSARFCMAFLHRGALLEDVSSGEARGAESSCDRNPAVQGLIPPLCDNASSRNKQACCNDLCQPDVLNQVEEWDLSRGPSYQVHSAIFPRSP